MGNSSSSSFNNHHLAAAGYCCCGKKRYIPSEQQCELLYNEMCHAYDVFTSKWVGVDRDLLLHNLLVMLRDGHPEIDTIFREVYVPSPSAATQEEKKRKLSQVSTATNKESTLPATAAIVKDPTFQGVRMPKEVLATIAKFCNRSDSNNFGSTCKAAHQVIEDPRYGVLKVWPISAVLRPFYSYPHHHPHHHHNIGGHEAGGELDVQSVVFTRDGSRAAVMYRKKVCPHHGHRFYGDTIYILAVLDRDIGLIGEWACYGDLTPTFSPDGQLLMCGRIVIAMDRIEVEVFQLPTERNQQGPITVSSHDLETDLSDRNLATVSFISNSTAAVMMIHNDAMIIPVHHIYRDDESISFTEPNSTLIGPPNIVLPPDYGGGRGRVAYYSDDKTELMAIVYYSGPRIIVHDRKRNVSVTIQKPDEAGQLIEPVFSHNGKLLVIAAQKYTEWVRVEAMLRGRGDELLLYDLDVDIIENIRPPRAFSFHYDSLGRYTGLSFSPDNKKVIARFCYEYPDDGHEYELIGDKLQVIDIEKGIIVSDGWNDDTWGTIVS